MTTVPATASLPTVEKGTIPLAFSKLLEGRRAVAEGTALRALRSAALERFRERGLPTVRDEDWRFTSMAPLARTAFVPAHAAFAATAGHEVDAHRLPSAVEAVFVDGLFAPVLSRTAGEGVVVASLRECFAREGSPIVPHFGRLTGANPSPFADLNTALFEEGTVVEVAPRSVVPLPIHLLFFSTGKAPVARFPRVLVLARAGSEATLVETYVGSGTAASLTCAVTEIVVEENAALRRYKLQDETEQAFHVSTLAARLARNGRFHDLSFSLGALLSRHDLTVTLDAEGAETSLDGLFFADGDRHTDTHTLIDHARPHGTSRQTYKGIVDGRGRGVFTGRVVVRKDAQKTDAAQTNNNLLLSKESLVHGAPQLEILADDVKCRHGATTGQLDEAAVFYLRSRGLSERAARGLLTAAFAAELVRRIGVTALRDRVSARLLSKLPGAAQVREAAL